MAVQTYSQLVAALAATETGFTNGYDAVVSVSAQQLNQFLFGQYAANGPNTGTGMQAMGASPDAQMNYWLIDFALGPPELSFSVAGAEADLSMVVTGGTITMVDLMSGTLSYALDLTGGLSTVAGNFPLSQVAGEESTTLGTVVLDMGAPTSWTADITALPGGSLSNASIASALTAYYQQQGFSYELGTVTIPKNFPANLTPTSFTFTGVPSAAAGTACVNFQILTTSNGNDATPVTQALIPTGSTVGVLVSAPIIQSSIVSSLNTAFTSYGVTYTAARNDGNGWTITGGGSGATPFTVGDLSTQGNAPLSSEQLMTVNADNSDTAAAVTLPSTGLTAVCGVSPTMSFSASSSVWWYWSFATAYSFNQKWQQANVSASYSTPITLGVSNTTVSLTLDWSGSVTSPGLSSDWQGLFNNYIQSGANSAMATALTTTLNSISLPDISEFMLTSVVYPNQTMVTLTDAALPYDLYSVGNTTTTWMLNQSVVELAPGGTFTFSVPGCSATGIIWSLTPPVGMGQIDATTGVYTAANRGVQPPPAGMAVVMATIPVGTGQDATNAYAYGLIQVNPAEAAITITPQALTLPSGTKYQFSVLPTSATPSVSSSADGTMTSRGGGNWIYAAPQVTTATTIAVTVTSGSDSITANWSVVPVDSSLSVSAPSNATTVTAGTAVTYIATSSTPDYLNSLTWVSYVTDVNGNQTAGGVFSPVTGATALYTAPTVASGYPLNATIIAYNNTDCASVANLYLSVNAPA